jgi:hypothetical protein
LPFDAYTLKARIAPALLVLLPLMATVYAWLPSATDLSLLAWLTPVGVAALVALAWETGRAGRRMQGELFASWGGAPTTQLLRHSNGELPGADKERYYNVLRLHRPDLAIPTAQIEGNDPAHADAVYENAVAWLREQTRDARRFPLVADENATFGFHRNLLAHRTVGYSACIVGVIGSTAALFLPHAVVSRGLFALIVSGVVAILIARITQGARVRESGFNYARVLLRALDGLPAS